ncbi:MAG: hypothetical protein HY698_21580 [Deltaproteobacteria bacterium]|nr:hypothetical protein [Deltaproteobacteria bacterium]
MTRVFLIFMCLAGCSGGGGVSLDGAVGGADASLDATPKSDAPIQGADASSQADASRFDAGPQVDSGPGPVGLVQCRTSRDCPASAQGCNRAPPGGICLGCSTSNDCPIDTYCNIYGGCMRGCKMDSECNLGMRCNLGGQCEVRPCPCPQPYVCGAQNLCERPACEGDAGASSCPSPLVCLQNRCVEP